MNTDGDMIYLDNAATTAVDRSVVAAMRPYLCEYYGNPSSVHSHGRSAAKALERTRKALADKLNARPDEILFTSGGTESNNLALKGLFFARASGMNHIITSAIEHPSIMATCRWLEQQGCRVTCLPVDSDGFVDPADLSRAIGRRTLVVSIAAANHEIGTLQPIDKVARICRDVGVIFHTDACQAFTKIPDALFRSVDFVSVSAHKIHGPNGVGALLVRDGITMVSLLSGGHQEGGLRAGTQNTAGIAGFGKAIEGASDASVQRTRRLRDRLIDEVIDKIPGTTLNGPRSSRLCNNANFTFTGVRGRALMLELDRRGVAVSTGSACMAGSSEPSEVLCAIGIGKSRAQCSLRFSLSKKTTRNEIDEAVRRLVKAVAKLRRNRVARRSRG